MWVFKSKVRNTYLATNPKVLGQTLLKQPTLERYVARWRYIHFLEKEINLDWGPEYIMLVRNPFTRLESFFREKLRQKVLLTEEVVPYTLKRHQQIFYEYLGLRDNDPEAMKVKRLLEFRFSEFIKVIPYVYRAEDHIAPQTYNFSRHFLGFNWRMKMNRIVQVEDSDSMQWLAQYLKLDLSIRANSSAHIKELLEWNNESVEIVRRIYQDDFRVFGYPLTPPSNIDR